MKEECLICKAPIEYLKKDELMECAICHKKEGSNARCVKGHYVCDECHTNGVDTIIGLCLNEKSTNPVGIIRKIMAQPFCHMHGPEHHVMVGSALLTAYKNSGGNVDLEASLIEMQNRGKKVPGGVCGLWGACGAAISSGIFISIITGATPLKVEEWKLSNRMTAQTLSIMADIGGPRCCKRNSYLAILSAVDFVKENFDLDMSVGDIVCSHFNQNNQCIKTRCPYFPSGK